MPTPSRPSSARTQRDEHTRGVVAAAARVGRAVEQIVDRHHDDATTRSAAIDGPEAAAVALR
jgi:hypothetical protein